MFLAIPILSTTTDSFTRNRPLNNCCSALTFLHQESFLNHFTRLFELPLLCTLTPSPGIFPETFYEILSTTAALHTDSFTRNLSRNILGSCQSKYYYPEAVTSRASNTHSCRTEGAWRTQPSD
ncbi:uncharacterized protein LOC113373664 [Ctenocephalides felis]|uniref:uncharacterized protein LOC113373664 n=1 Tax=Ctenocephalides felis TaxID=7515 RepID=UPI000E6E1BCB|nr:uncharacterized protein LOC113373664 [Ctenocephalides felis]